jgi:hypothetical protein
MKNHETENVVTPGVEGTAVCIECWENLMIGIAEGALQVAEVTLMLADGAEPRVAKAADAIVKLRHQLEETKLMPVLIGVPCHGEVIH